MRILPIALSVLMIFTPAYSAYASMLPTKGQIIAIGKKGGAMIKTSGGRIVKGGAIGIGIEGARIGIGAAISWCKNNQKKCKDKIGDIAELACDDFECTAETPDDDQPPDQLICYTAGARKHSSPDEACRQTYQFDPNVQFIADTSEKYTSSNPNTVGYCEGYYPGLTYKSSFSTVSKVPCDEKPQKEKRPLTDDELNDLAKKIAENMDDDDIINYYNTDYGDIIINNKRYDGDDINSQTNIDNRCNNNSCHEISKEIEQDVRSKKYDIDDVTPENCTMSNNKYISCKKPDSDSNDDTNDDTNKDDTATKKEDEEDPYKCGTTDLTKKICSFLDWSKSGDYDDEDDKVKIKEDEEDKPNTKVEFTGTCPAPYEIDISLDAGFMGTIDYDFVLLDTPKLCTFLDDWVEPIVYVLGPLHAIYILGGNRENV